MIGILTAYTIPAFHADGKFKHFITNATRHYTIHLVKRFVKVAFCVFGPPIFG